MSGCGGWLKDFVPSGYVPCGMPYLAPLKPLDRPGMYLEFALTLPPPVVAPKPAEVCPTCKAGKLENGVASMPSECCAIYFLGAGSEMHMAWKEFQRTPEERRRRCVASDALAAERMAAEECPPFDEKALRTRISGLGRSELVEEIVALRRQLDER